MAASYPTGVKNFGTPHADYSDTIYAAHPNDIQDEVVAIETILGVNPQGASSTVAERIGSLETGVNGALLKSGGTMTGAINMGANKVTNLGTPTSAADAATKDYVDTVAAGASPSAAAGIVQALLFAGI